MQTNLVVSSLCTLSLSILCSGQLFCHVTVEYGINLHTCSVTHQSLGHRIAGCSHILDGVGEGANDKERKYRNANYRVKDMKTREKEGWREVVKEEGGG